MTRRVLILLAALAALAAMAVPAGAAVRPSVELLPDGLTRPIIESAELMAPGAHNDLLEADLVIDTDTDAGIRHFEYRWNRGTPGAAVTTSVVNPTVSYASIRPRHLLHPRGARRRPKRMAVALVHGVAGRDAVRAERHRRRRLRRLRVLAPVVHPGLRVP